MKYVLSFIAGGIALLAILFGWSYYEENYRDAEIYRSLGEGLSESLLRDVVLSVEQFKLIFKYYPESIDELRGGLFHSDPASDECKCGTDYFYQKTSESTYFLFSKGKDCLAFTEDDIYPDLSDKQRSSIGIRRPEGGFVSESIQTCEEG